MSIINDRCILLSKTRYSDNTIIFRAYTESKGYLSFMVKGFIKKKILLYNLDQLNIIYNYNINKEIYLIKDINLIYNYKKLYYEMNKIYIVFFLSEMLELILSRESENHNLFKYIKECLILLDNITNDYLFNFHLLFFINLTRFLGFYPVSNQGKFFNISQGMFINYNHHYNIDNKSSNLFRYLLGKKSLFIKNNLITKIDRNIILDCIIKYYKYHMNIKKNIKSLDVLRNIL